MSLNGWIAYNTATITNLQLTMYALIGITDVGGTIVDCFLANLRGI